MLRLITIGLLLVFSSVLLAQEPENFKPPSVKKEPRILKQWNLSPDYSEEVPLKLDTAFSLFHRIKIADKYSPINATLGNYGLPFYQVSFFDRVTDPDKFLYSNYYPFMFVPDKAVFMNTQVPFTELVWSFGAPRETSEQTFRIRHSQNINRFLNFGIIYDIVYSLGQYNYQRAEDKDFTLYTSYTGNVYKLYFSVGLNKIYNLENGGIKDDSYLGKGKTREIPVNLDALDNASSRLNNRNLLLVQRLTLGGKAANSTDSVPKKRSGFFGLSGTLSHILTMESNKRTYSDAYPKSGFYDSTFISTKVTFDSLYSRNIENTLRFDFTTDETRKFRLGGGFGIRNEIMRYSQIVPTHDTIVFSDTATWNRSNNVLVGRLFNDIGDKFRWVATGELFISGYRAGDFNINGEISKSFDWKKGRASWLLYGDVLNRKPSFWYERWGSNHFEWDKNMNKEFRIDLGTKFVYPARKAELKFNYAIIDNYTDFDLTAHPAQYSGGLSVVAVTVSKELIAWKFHLANDIIIQKSSNSDILDLPLVALRSAGFFEHLFRFSNTGGKLNIQLGAEVTYNSLYHAYAFMPASGRFYRQNELTTGNYPFINVFFNFKIKRTTSFLMFDHAFYGLMGNNYSNVPSYPMNIRMLRYGLCWTFYD